MTGEGVTVDVRGLACPIPVIRTKKALEGMEQGTVSVLVDEAAARENVIRLAAHMGCSERWEAHEGGWLITITGPGTSGENP